MSKHALQSVQAEYADKRKKALDAAVDRERELSATIPEYACLLKRIVAIGPELLRLGISGGADFQAKSEQLYIEHETLVNRKKSLLVKHGYPEDYDMPKFECSICNDTGVVGDKGCACIKRATARRAYYTSGLGKALDGQTFESFDMRYYGGKTKSGFSVNELMQNVFEYCKSYAESFKTGSDSLLMIGGAGLGKTHLATAIARVVIDKGHSVVYESAQNVVNSYEAEHFGRSTNADTGRYTDCELLIIDDLGTEFVTPFSVSVFFNLLNHRIINGLPTIVTTNLKLSEIETNYKERIYSRLLGDYTTLAFCGSDIRRIKKENENI